MPAARPVVSIRSPYRNTARRGVPTLWFALVLLCCPAFTSCGGHTAPPAQPWRTLEPGLDYAEFEPPLASAAADPRVRVLRADPDRFALKLLTAASQADPQTRTPKQWASEKGLLAVINAAMYQADHRTSVSLMRSGSDVNNPRLSKDQCVLVFDPTEAGLPPVQLIDREHQDFDRLRGGYRSMVQSIRMISLSGENVWEQQLHNRWSVAAVGFDQQGRILFIHSRMPLSVHDLVESLLRLPLELKNAMYTEGGPEAQLYVNAGGFEAELAGAIDAGFHDGLAAQAWPVPNVLGLVRAPQR